MEFLDSVLATPIFYSLSVTLLHFLWQGLLIALCLYGFLKITDNKLSALRYAVSLAAMALNIIIPLATFFIIYQSHSESLNMASFAEAVIEASGFADASTAAENYSWSWQDFVPALSIIWMFGVVFLSGQLLIEMFNVYQLPRRGVQQPSQQLQQLFNQLANKIKVNKAARLLISSKAEVPMVVGWIFPVVLLPVSMSTGLTSSQLAMLLTHELAHIKRYDYLVNFFQTLIEIILFFHPCVKWVSTQVRAEREYCCDDVAVHHCGNSLAYAHALTDAELLRPHNIPELAMAASGGNLKKRIFRVVEQKGCSPQYFGQWLASVLSFTLVVSIFTAGHVVGSTRVIETLSNPEMMSDQSVGLPTTKSPMPVIKSAESNDRVVNLNIPNKADISPTVKTVNDAVKKPTDNLVTSAAKKPVSRLSKRATLTSEADKPLIPAIKATPEQKTTSLAAYPSLPAKIDVPDNTRLAIATEKPDNVANSAEKISAIKIKASDIAGSVSLNLNADKQPVDPIKVASLATQSRSSVKPSAIQSSLDMTEKVEPNKSTKSPSDIIQPKLVKIVKPNYPKSAINNQLSGDIEVSFVVKVNGRVSQVKFENKADWAFKRAIKSAMRKWRFEAGSIKGEKAEMKITKVFSFTEPPEFSAPTTGSRMGHY